MTLEQLYEEMKASLKFFDLRFNDMDQVTVHIDNHSSEIVLTHNGRKICIDPGAYK